MKKKSLMTEMSTSVFAEKPPLVLLVWESIRMTAEMFLSLPKGENNSKWFNIMIGIYKTKQKYSWKYASKKGLNF